MSDRQRHGLVLLLVAGLVAASLVVIFSQKTQLGLDLKGGVQLVYQGEPTAQSKVTPDALSRAVDIMRSRVDSLGVSEPVIQTSGGNQISVGLPSVTNTSRAEQEVGTTARLEFYDWEANALTPAGKTVASGLQTQDPNATTISQGVGSALPGSIGAGSLPLYQAVKLAAAQPAAPNANNARYGREYYLFGAPGSTACATAAKDRGYIVQAGQHCMLLSQPLDETTTNPTTIATDLASLLPAGVKASQGQQIVVPQGTVVLLAAPTTAGQHLNFYSPNAQFYVLKDNVALFGNDITNPQPSTDQAGNPDVTFGFNGPGQNKFQSVTAAIAHRGDLVSGFGQTLNQHFAVALDNKLITVPSIDFKTYPDGITGGGGADITGGFTTQSASDLATQLRLGALPIKLRLISESDVSATLGKQALNQGLVAGAVGLLVVALFLLAYYRVLGVIATAALVVYGLYFYALIKLIPITLTLPGIAGLILTIGVAADANIVIFERVKEEIRAGRSIRSGIVTGYKKGLTAIIDANVVTIMTAFILFVLATAQVQGFAFTLGIGVIVSLFTAVLATQAILTTMGDSRMIARPSALGAGKSKRVWRFDFMGASRYFFSMSGVILLIGALAIGGRGLNLGIDFTSGTRITTSLSRTATAAQVQATVAASGALSPVVQKIDNKALGNDVFQISAKELQPGKVGAVRTALNTKYGVKSFDDSSVGPTFGQTVTNSAVIAIIASLVVISAYVALRFQWKFAVPVLIALMHDLLITSGVYALTGREVTVDTVAALLTILGYSLYDTIIVFDRVRENIPRMPRAAFSQIVNRSMSEVLTRSIATTSCTLLPILALLLFGGATLQDFAFALLIGVASGAYSSIFIASPVLTHWKERETAYRHRRERIVGEFGFVPAYAGASADIEPTRPRGRGRTGRLTTPEAETVSSAEFEQLKRDIADEEAEPSRHTSTLTQRLAHTRDNDAPAAAKAAPGSSKPARAAGKPARAAGKAARAAGKPARAAGKAAPASGKPGPASRTPARPASPEAAPPEAEVDTPPANGDGDGFERAPDVPENDGVAQSPKANRPAKRPRNRRHGRHR
jgi:SecD/SecF fusion protein